MVVIPPSRHGRGGIAGFKLLHERHGGRNSDANYSQNDGCLRPPKNSILERLICFGLFREPRSHIAPGHAEAWAKADNLGASARATRAAFRVITLATRFRHLLINAPQSGHSERDI
jgi:hypothetical protein